MKKEEHKEVLALIPARSGSKGIPGKNIRPFCGKPMIAWSIEQALKASCVDRVVVSTDSEQYAAVARKYGAEVPFIRPAELATDQAGDLEVFQHALQWLEQNEQYTPDVCVHLRPTYPVRSVETIEQVVKCLLSHDEIDSVRTVCPSPYTPFKMWTVNETKLLKPVCSMKDIVEPWNRPRQELPSAYLQTANVDAVWARVVITLNSMTGDRIMGYMEDQVFDIDTEEDFLAAERVFVLSRIDREMKGPVSENPCKTFCFDIDGVIATIVPDNDYNMAKPRRSVIEKINWLYDRGQRIILNTARGYVTGIDWREVTKKQLADWDVKYHELHFGKPAADYYVDDKMLSLEDLERML